MTTNFKRDGYHSVTPQLLVKNASELIGFLEQVFDAEVVERYLTPDGNIMHAMVRIGDSPVMIADASQEFPERPGMLVVYVEDTDATYQRALTAGASVIREPKNEFYGDRTAGVVDGFGNQWWLATHIEDVSEEKLQRRMEVFM